MTSKDNRRSSRTPLESVLEIYDDQGHFITGTGRLVNYSDVGICFSTTKALKTGDRLRARLRLKKDGVVEVSACVVWCRKKPSTTLYGVAFDSVQKIKG